MAIDKEEAAAAGGKKAEEMRKKHGEEKKKKKNKGMVPFYKLFSFADTTDVVLMVLGTVGAVTNGAAQPLMTVLFGNVTDSFGGTRDVDQVVHKISKVALDFVYLAVVSGIASFLQVTCWMSTGERQAARIRNLYLKAILRQDIAFFDKETNAGETIGRISGDAALIQDAMGEKVGEFIQLVSTFLSGFIVALSQGWLLTLVMLTTIPVIVVTGSAMAAVIARTASNAQTSYAEAANVVDQTIGSIRTVASFTGEERSVNKYGEALKSACNSGVQEGLAIGLGIGTAMLLLLCGSSLGIWYGAMFILSKGYTGAQVITVMFAVLIGAVYLGQASPCVVAFAAGQASAFKMFEAINRKPEIDAYDNTGKILDDICGDVEFRDVYFSYPARPDQQIFSGFSLVIQSGMTMALVGESGSGKSTVISLIERFYDPQAGEILIDGINIKELQLRWLRGKLGLVSQEPVLFASTIKDNIAYGKDDATIEEIRAAADLANASNFIEEMPQGIDTIVGEHGTLLSGGQKQRVAIARAILRDPRILLLDEATSALDSESERIVQEALDRVMTNRTTVIVAHRLSTVRNANIIAVLHRGVIIEKGSHSELLKNTSGAYCKLIHTLEINQDFHPTSQIDKERNEAAVDMAWNLSPCMSFNLSTTLGSPFGNSSHHSFSEPFKSPVELNIQENIIEKLDTEVPFQQPDVSLLRLACLNKPEIIAYIIGTTAAIAEGVIFPIFGMLLSNVIITFYQPPPKLQKDSKFWSLMFLMLGLMSLLAIIFRTYFFAMAGSNLTRRLRLMTFQKVVCMEIGWFDKTENSSGAIGARLSADAATVRSLVGDTLSLAVQNTTTSIAGLVIAFAANWRLSLTILALIPMISLNYWIQLKFMKGFSANAKIMYREASQVANDAMANIRTVASFSAEDKVVELYKLKCEGPTWKRIREGMISGVGFGVSNFLLFCVEATTFYAAARLLQEGKTTSRDFFQVFLVLSITAIGISQSCALAPDSKKAKIATASIFAILDRISKIDSNDDSGLTLEELKGEIEFHHVNFRYPTRPDVQIFQDFCLSIQPGKTVALVGESGSGKSTAISLMQRFYDPDSGHILLDGVEIQKFQLRWLRQQMGLVSQEPTLFNDTIRANIAYGKEGRATESEIIASAKLSNAHKFISCLPQGYDTLVGERGIQLSGGQKQRIAIARAIMKDPKILLLDEATSALDVESERAVQDALNCVMMNRTTVVIAHRLSAIKDSDLIAVVKNGMIIEKGQHEILINIEDGAYASLVALNSRASS